MGRHNLRYQSPRRTRARWRRHHPPSPSLAEFVADFERKHPEVMARIRDWPLTCFYSRPIEPIIEPMSESPWPPVTCMWKVSFDPRLLIKVDS